MILDIRRIWCFSMLCLLFLLYILNFAEIVLAEDTRIGGYGELHYNKPTRGFELPHSAGVLDFHRFVVYVGHNFNSWIWFNSEIELEHTYIKGGEDTGELSIAQTFLNLQFHRHI